MLLAAIPGLGALVLLIASIGNGVTWWGDEALLEAAVHNAANFDQALGPYSNWGFSHPGPAMFYVMAPFYALLGNSPLALSVAAVVINTASMVATVAVVRHFLGRRAAWITAVIVVVFALAARPQVMWDHWNPTLVPLPLLLAMVLAAAAWSGSSSALAGALFVGSAVAQTHLGAGPLVAAIVLLGMAGWMISRLFVRGGSQREREPFRWRKSILPVALFAATAAMWVPAIVEQTANDPGNLTNISSFFDNPPEGNAHGHPASDAVQAVANEAFVIPLGRGSAPTNPHTLGQGSTDRYLGVGAGQRLTMWIVALVLAAASVVYVLRRKGIAPELRRVLLALSLLPIVLNALMVYCATRIVGPMWNYLLWSAAVFFLPGWIAAATLITERFRGIRYRLARHQLVALGMAGMLGVVVWTLELVEFGELRPDPLALATTSVMKDVGPDVRGANAVEVRWPLDDANAKAVANGVLAAMRREDIEARPWADLYMPGHGARGSEECVLAVGTLPVHELDPDAVPAVEPRSGAPYLLACRR